MSKYKVGQKVVLINQTATGRPQVRYANTVGTVGEVLSTSADEGKFDYPVRVGTIAVGAKMPDLVLECDVVAEELYNSPLYEATR